MSDIHFEIVFNESPIGMALVAPEGKFLKVNQSLCNIVGYTKEELLEKTFQDITHPDDLQKDLEYVHQMLDNSIQRYRMEKRYYHKDGHVVWILLAVALVRDGNDEPQYFISQIEDITELVEKRQALEEKNKEYQKLLDISINREAQMADLKHRVESDAEKE